MTATGPKLVDQGVSSWAVLWLLLAWPGCCNRSSTSTIGGSVLHAACSRSVIYAAGALLTPLVRDGCSSVVTDRQYLSDISGVVRRCAVLRCAVLRAFSVLRPWVPGLLGVFCLFMSCQYLRRFSGGFSMCHWLQHSQHGHLFVYSSSQCWLLPVLCVLDSALHTSFKP